MAAFLSVGAAAIPSTGMHTMGSSLQPRYDAACSRFALSVFCCPVLQVLGWPDRRVLDSLTWPVLQCNGNLSAYHPNNSRRTSQVLGRSSIILRAIFDSSWISGGFDEHKSSISCRALQLELEDSKKRAAEAELECRMLNRFLGEVKAEKEQAIEAKYKAEATAQAQVNHPVLSIPKASIHVTICALI